MTRVCLTSDWHGTIPEIPECDLLVIAGDICPDFIRYFHRGPDGARQRHNGEPEQMRWLLDVFCPWLAQAPPAVVIGGNHDYVIESAEPRVATLIESCGSVYLRDSGASIAGLKVYGTPWVPNLPNWAFYGDDDMLESSYEEVPEGLDLLVTHGPPLGYGDKTSMRFATDPEDFDGHVGSIYCLDAIHQKEPRAVAWGHIHEGYGHYRIPLNSDPNGWADGYNVALKNERYEPVNAPVVIDL